MEEEEEEKGDRMCVDEVGDGKRLLYMQRCRLIMCIHGRT